MLLRIAQFVTVDGRPESRTTRQPEIDTFNPEPSEIIPIGNDIFLRRSIKNGKLVGATIANYSLWHSELSAAKELKPQYAKVLEN